MLKQVPLRSGSDAVSGARCKAACNAVGGLLVQAVLFEWSVGHRAGICLQTGRVNVKQALCKPPMTGPHPITTRYSTAHLLRLHCTAGEAH